MIGNRLTMFFLPQIGIKGALTGFIIDSVMCLMHLFTEPHV